MIQHLLNSSVTTSLEPILVKNLGKLRAGMVITAFQENEIFTLLDLVVLTKNEVEEMLPGGKFIFSGVISAVRELVSK